MTSPAPDPCPLSRSLRTPRSAMLLSVLLLIVITPLAFAGSATWKSDPISTAWNNRANWEPRTVPKGPADIATFANSNATAISVFAPTEVSEIVFSPGASAFTITTTVALPLKISGAGIVNDSGLTQQFVVDATDQAGPDDKGVTFANSATAGNGTKFTVAGGVNIVLQTGGTVVFNDQSSADNAVFDVLGADIDAGPEGRILFNDNSRAGNATIVTHRAPEQSSRNGIVQLYNHATMESATAKNYGYVSFYDAANAGSCIVHNFGLVPFYENSSASDGIFFNNAFGTIAFYDASTAANGIFVNSGGTQSEITADTQFYDDANAAAATLIAQPGGHGATGGEIAFHDATVGGTARIELFGDGFLDISDHDLPGISTGSIEGDGSVFLGGNNLTVGTNNGSTKFTGIIQDGGLSDGTGGSLNKIGSGTLSLGGANTYTGLTEIDSGVLRVNNKTGSGTGTGAVLVRAGSLGGKGTVAGTVTIGTSSGPGAFLAPSVGVNKPATLRVESALSLKADSTYAYQLDSALSKGDTIVANGVTVDIGAQFAFSDVSNDLLPTGTVITPISNTAATAIAGTFSNLPDGGTITVGQNTFQANYEGGDGNDLTLTVVP